MDTQREKEITGDKMAAINIYTDVETYITYNNEEDRQAIIENSETRGEEAPEPEQGRAYPVLDATRYYLGATLTITRKRGKKEEQLEYYGSALEHRNNIDKKIREADENNDMVTIWAHNHHYDFLAYMRGDLKRRIENNQITIIRNTPFLALQGKHRYVDTLAFYPGSLKELGELIGSPKLQLPRSVREKEELKTYLEQDLRVMEQANEKLREMLKEMGYKPQHLLTPGKLATTWLIAQIAKRKDANWLIQRGRFHINEQTVDKLRKTSKGGASIAIQTGEYKDCTYLDRRSAYWKSMQEMPFPDLLTERSYDEEYLNEMNDQEIIQLLEKEGAIHCTILTDKHPIGLLATRSDGKTIYPGEGRTLKGWWTTYEIREAMKEGYELYAIHDMIIYQKNIKDSPLKEFTEKLYAEKLRRDKEGQAFETKILKRIGNSLYGKFLQGVTGLERTTIKQEELDKRLAEGWVIIDNEVNEQGERIYHIRKEEKTYYPRYLAIAIGSGIAARARIAVMRTVRKLGKQAIYCDTDGIIIQGEIPDWIEINEEPGAYKIEKQGDCTIIREKVYVFGKEGHASGTRKNNELGENLKAGRPTKSYEIRGLIKGDYEGAGKLIYKEKEHKKKEETNIPYYIEEK